MALIEPIKFESGRLTFLDQTLLPNAEKYIDIKTKEDLWDAIHKLKVRGAPAIGVAAAYGMALMAEQIYADTKHDFFVKLSELKKYIGSSRPTAVNLFWAIDRIEKRAVEICEDKTSSGEWNKKQEQIKEELIKEAELIHKEDIEKCCAMGEHGLSFLKPGMGILTYCNAGAIATSKYGTCLAPIHLGAERNYNFKVYACETRPLLQGARLTSWELYKNGVDVTLICDNMAATVMKKGLIDAVVVGCDRMAANGDGANKIGTSGVAILAKEYGIPFYMFVPTPTIDLNTASGEQIIIEERNGEEIYNMWYSEPMAPVGIKTFNPAFDVTDSKYITAVVSEKGIAYPSFDKSLPLLFEN